VQSLNLDRVWQNLNAPVPVVYGTGDPVVSRADSDAIADRATRRGVPGQSRQTKRRC
jgi:alpha-beta hydrolase superfamily lysophospholipase